MANRSTGNWFAYGIFGVFIFSGTLLMRMLELTHANMPDTKIVIVVDQIFCFYFSQAHQTTHIVGPGSSMIPVAESVARIQQLLGGEKYVENPECPEYENQTVKG